MTLTGCRCICGFCHDNIPGSSVFTMPVAPSTAAGGMALLAACRVPCSTDSCSRNCLTKAYSPPLPSTAPADVEGAALSTGAGGDSRAGGASIGAGYCDWGLVPRAVVSVGCG